MDTSLKDIFSWLVNAPVWMLLAIPFVIFIAVNALNIFRGLEERLTIKADGSERYGGRYILWISIIAIYILVVEGGKLILEN